MNKTIIIVTICLSFLQTSIWWAWGTFRRTGDEIAKIRMAVPVEKDFSKECIEAGGIPRYWNGKFTDCDKK